MAVNPIDVYRIVSDPSLDPDAKRASIDMLYGVAAPAPAPDLRMADASGGDPTSVMFGSGDQRPAPPPVATDAGGMSSTPPVASMPAMSVAPPVAAAPPVPSGGASMPPPAAAPAASEATQSAISPEALAAAAATKASTPRAPAPPAPPPPSGQELTNEVLRQMVERQLQGGPVRAVAAHDQPIGSVVETKAPIAQEIKDRVTGDAKQEARLAAEQGDQAAKAHTDAAILADQQARDARAQQAEQAEKRRLEEEHIQSLDAEHSRLVKDTEDKPGAFWSSRNTGQKILSFIGAVMFGLGGSPEGLQKVIDADVARRAQNREKTLGASKSALDSFRSRMLSPEAAHQAELALSARAVAADATRLAETAASAESRVRGLQLAQHFLTQADQHDEEMARLESAATKTQIKHVPRGTVGGSPGLGAAIDQVSRATGVSKEKVFRAAIGAGGGEAMSADERGQAESKLGRTVVFPDGAKLYARPGETNEVQDGVRSASEILDAYSQLEALASKPGHSLSPDDLARIEPLLSSNLLRLATSNKLGAISEGDQKLINPLAGVAAGDTFAFNSATLAGIKQARQLVQNRLNTLRKTLFTEPFSNEKTGGVTAASVEVPAP